MPWRGQAPTETPPRFGKKREKNNKSETPVEYFTAVTSQPGHKRNRNLGNMDLNLKRPFVNPTQTVTCPRAEENFKNLFRLLSEKHFRQKPVFMKKTGSPALKVERVRARAQKPEPKF